MSGPFCKIQETARQKYLLASKKYTTHPSASCVVGETAPTLKLLAGDSTATRLHPSLMRTGLQARPKPGSAKARRRLSDVLNAQTSSTLVHPRPLSPPPRSDFFHPPFLFSGVSHCSCSPYSSKDSTPLDRPADGAHGAPMYSKPRPSCRTQNNGRGSCPYGTNRRRHPLRRYPRFL